MNSDIALSTMWAVGRFPNLIDFFEAGKKLGFGRFELNHSVNSAMLDGISLDGMIASIHEPCPADISTKELKQRNWLISAPDEENRRQGVLATRRSIDLAHELGARVVIVHPGQVDIDPSLESTLVSLYHAGKFNQPEYIQAKEKLVTKRGAQAETNLRSVRRSLGELANYAAQWGIRLGLENRFHYQEIPLPDELDQLLDLDHGEIVGYWHDIGHAQVLEHLGFNTHEEWLRRFAGPHGRVLGVHLHDVKGITDHLAVGLGRVDWDMVARYLPDSALRTCEFHSSNSPQEVAAGLKWLVDRKV
ncbi:MAG: sugar phosphate isomerase/epimerase [Anaerolineales bacterium]|nr:sugar phosphate isomerase/epimerase [Anaerolineales bacterium]